MKYKLVDVINEVKENVQFGTCELCMHFGTHRYDVIVLQDENGEMYHEEMGEWNWGDYIGYHVDNYIEFASWLSKIDIEEPLNIGYLVDEYNYREED